VAHPVDVTVITPTYNRAHLLPRLYESLQAQTFTGFEWLVIDDGSTDETRELVRGWDAPFPITYVHQANAGMKVAWNRGVELARGNYVAVIGSDDRYLRDGLERLTEEWRDLDDGFASVNGRAIDPDGGLVGPPFEGTIDVDSFTLLYRYGIAGDTAGLARTEIVRRFPFPYAESRAAPEATAFNRIARHYKTRFLSEPVVIVDYQPGGLSGRDRSERLADPRPWLLYYWEAFTFPRWVPLHTRAKFALNCIRFGTRRLLTTPRRFG
jgi:glycosyltransferase involved in cell wall biosynthesis